MTEQLPSVMLFVPVLLGHDAALQFGNALDVVITLTCRTTITQQMRLRPLPEFAMNRTDYQDFRAHVLIVCLRIIVFVTMHRPCSGDKHFLIDPLVCLSLATMRTALSHKMVSRTLKENDTTPSALYPYWRMRIDVFHFRIVVLVAMYLLCFSDELFNSFSFVIHKHIVIKWCRDTSAPFCIFVI